MKYIGVKEINFRELKSIADENEDYDTAKNIKQEIERIINEI